MATRMQQRRGTAAQWTAANPILAAGEIGFETDTNKFKMGNGSSTWSALQYFANAAELAAIIDGAPDLLNTLNELAASIGDDPTFFTSVANNLSAHASDTTSVHGIANTALLATQQNVDDKIATATTIIDNTIGTSVTAHIEATTGIHGIDDTEQLATKDYADGAVSDHNAVYLNVHGIADTTALALTSDLSSHASDTSNVHGIEDTQALATKTYADNAVSTHNSDSTDVHGISNTANLVYTADLNDHTGSTLNVHGIADTSDLVTTEILADHVNATTDVHGISNVADLVTVSMLADAVTPSSLGYAGLAGTGLDYDAQNDSLNIDSTVATKTYATDAVSTHNSDTTDVHGIADTSVLATSTTVATAKSEAIAAAGTAADSKISTAVAALTKSSVGLGNVDNTSDANKPVSTATQTALDLKANLAGPTFTGTVVLPSTTSIGNVSATELGYVDGVTSAIQTQIDAKLSKSGGTMTGDLTLAGAPTADLHAATKAYVDNVVSGINFHQPVRVATTANITLSGTQTIDGVSVVAGDRVLVKDQTDQKTNGIYVVASGSWTRATDADNTPAGELAGGDFCLVLEGTVGSGYGYVCSNTSAITIGTTNITYAAFNAAKAVTAGSGLTESTPGTLDIATGGVTSAMIADGTIVDGDISSSAAIAQSKISGLSTSLGLKANLAAPSFTGGVTVDSSGIIFTDGTQTKEGTPSRTPIIQKTAAYTLSSLTERDSLIEVSHTGASAVQITIPTDATLNFPIGTSIDILQTNTGGVTVAAATPATTTVNATPGTTLRTQWSSATLFKRAANTWVVYGDLK
jgi:hypothetical protein